MPSQMIHLLTARKYNFIHSPLYWAGSVCPDAVSMREDKDKCHFRCVPDREAALRELAGRTDPHDYFAEGVLLHLYLDFLWDREQLSRYREWHGDGWFLPYRQEIGIASSYIYHTTEWSAYVWEEMDKLDISQYGEIPCVTQDELKAFIVRNKKWHSENKIGPSEFYTASIVEGFIDSAVERYNIWRKINR